MKRVLGLGVVLSLLAFGLLTITPTAQADVAGISITPSSGTVTYSQGAVLTPSDTTLASDHDDTGLSTTITLTDSSNTPVNFDTVFSSFGLTTNGDGPYDLVTLEPGKSTLSYGPDSYTISSTTQQVTTLTGAISATAPAGTYTITTQVLKGSEVQTSATYTVTIVALATDTNTGTGYSTLQAAIDAAAPNDVITLSADATLSEQVTVKNPVTIDGNGHTIFAPFAKTGSDNNAAIGIIDTSDVTIQNLTIDGTHGTDLHGINVFKSDNIALDSVTLKNNAFAGLVVNGSNVTATSLTTNGNSRSSAYYGSVNVDPGTGITSPSVFTLVSGTLGDSLQIWSDGNNVTTDATVTVNADGYGEYLVAGSSVRLWSNKSADDTVFVSHDGVNTIYTSLQAAVSAAVSGDTVYVTPGDYNGDITITKALILAGPNVDVNPLSNRGPEAVITGQVNVYAGDVTVSGFTITNPLWNGATIKGLYVYSDGPVTNNITLKDNIVSGIHNAAAHGAYGVMIQGEVDNVSVTDNRFDDITSAGWAHAIEVTPTGTDTTVPTNVTIQGNSISSITATGGDQYGFSVDTSGGVHADASQVYFNQNNLSDVAIRNLDTLHSLDATNNYWGSVTGPADSTLDGDISFSPWYIDADKTTLSDSVVLPGDDGSATVSDDKAEVVVTSPTQAITIAAGDVTNATVNLSSLVSAGVVAAPQITVSSDNADVVIPSTTITSSDSSWDGIINLPKIVTTTVTPTATAGNTVNVVSSIEIGAGETPLTLNNAAKLVFAGQAGNQIGWSQAGTFHEITDTCSSDTNPTLAAGADCKINVGADLVVYTKHFTTFTVYTQSATPVSSSGGGSSSEGGHRQDVTSPTGTNTGAGQVLGAFTSADNQEQIAALKQQLVGLMQQLLSLLQAELSAAIAAGQH